MGVADSCCTGADSVYLNLSSNFVNGTTCITPPIVPGITIYIAGGCSDSGELYYGEQCGGSGDGPFSYLTHSNGTQGQYLGAGACAQPAEQCKCNAYVKTSTSGCYNIATPPNFGVRYFLQVENPVCTNTDTGTRTTAGTLSSVAQPLYGDTLQFGVFLSVLPLLHLF